jgi:DNA-binding NarL/FixJ family response regulator
MSIRVVVVDDQEIVRAGFAALLDTQPTLPSSAPPRTVRRQSGSAATRARMSC